MQRLYTLLSARTALAALHLVCCRPTAVLVRQFFIDQPTKLLGQAFTPLVLFLAGMSTVGSFSGLTSLKMVAFPLSLVALKSLVLPILIYSLTLSLGGNSAQAEFGFIYGLLPAANGCLVIARGYKLDETTLSSVAVYLALGKVCAYPLLLLAAIVAAKGGDVDSLLELKLNVGTALLVLGALGTAWCVVNAVWIPVWRACPLRRALVLCAIQCVYSVLHVLEATWRDAPPATQAAAFALVSFLRWAVLGWVSVMA